MQVTQCPGAPVAWGCQVACPTASLGQTGPRGIAGRGAGGTEDDVGDEVTSTKGSRAKLSSFSCSHRFPIWGRKQASLGGTNEPCLPLTPHSHTLKRAGLG